MEVMGKVHRRVMEVMVRVHLRGMVMAVEADTDKHDKFHIIKIPHCLIGRVEAIFFVCVQRVSRSRGMIPRSLLMIFLCVMMLWSSLVMSLLFYIIMNNE
jgi:hypothetical protein